MTNAISKISVIACVLLCFPACFAFSIPDPIQIDSGILQGKISKSPSGLNVIEYRGIPYAQNPTGVLRWALPVPATPWKGTLNATQFGPACPQVSRFNLTDESIEEDCLSINVSAPADLHSGEKRPVLFWIHGGGLVGGASNLYRLDKLASEGRMIVVSANYRLGFLGFVPLPGLAKQPINGNFGIEDQREALRWVQRNISAFGGDPDNVTIFGESAGGGSVCAHLSSPEQVKGLFHKAIIVSIACLAQLKSVTEATNTNGKEIANNLGCTDVEDQLKCLREKSVVEILDVQTKFVQEHPTNLTIFAPTHGTPEHPNATLPTSISDALARKNGGSFSKVPLLMGVMEKELLLYVGYWWQNALNGNGPSVNNQTINRFWLEHFYGKHSKTVATKYGFDDPKVAGERLGEALSDFNPLVGINNCLIHKTADQIIAYPSALPAYVFEFADPNAPVKGIGMVPPYPDFSLGPVHSSILNYWFPNFSNNRKIDAPDLSDSSQTLANQMIQFLANFVESGQPHANKLPDWPVYKNSQHIFKFAPGHLKPYDAGATHKCEWWKSLYPDLGG